MSNLVLGLVLAGTAVLIFLSFYNLYCQIKKMDRQVHEYTGTADEPNDNKQVTSVPEKQIGD
jgi:hypothetical protein